MKKVLLMGASGSGKTSMRSLIFSNNPASLTSRLGATIDVEQNHVRFLGDLILNPWDCGGQDAFMDSYLSTQRSTIFQHVDVLIYVFEVGTHDAAKDAAYYRDCLDALQKYSPEAGVFLLVHKVDLVTGDRTLLLERRSRELPAESGAVRITVFGTNTHDESLYKVWSRIVHAIISKAAILFKHFTTCAQACSATEAILFEHTTFLVIAASSHPDGPEQADDLSSTLYERINELIKALKLSDMHHMNMEIHWRSGGYMGDVFPPLSTSHEVPWLSTYESPSRISAPMIDMQELKCLFLPLHPSFNFWPMKPLKRFPWVIYTSYLNQWSALSPWRRTAILCTNTSDEKGPSLHSLRRI